MSEQVLVFHQELLARFKPHFINGICTNKHVVEDFASEVLYPANVEYIDRKQAEDDPTYKQVIPYCVLTHHEKGVFSYRRTKKGGEARLHELRSLGVGGHINPCDELTHHFDGEFYGYYGAALRRELKEEVGIVLQDYISDVAPIKALIYDPANPVGRVHLGLVHFVAAPAELALTDKAIADGQWSLAGELHAQAAEFENWSQLIIKSGILQPRAS